MKTLYAPPAHTLAARIKTNVVILIFCLLSFQSLHAQSWTPLGISEFSQPSPGGAIWPDITKDKNGNLYLVYTDQTSGKAVVSEYDGTTWQMVGKSGFSAGRVYYTHIAVDSTGIPYVIYVDGADSNKATVMKYNGGNWVKVGSGEISIGSVQTPSITVDKNGTPYIAYVDFGMYGFGFVKKFNGTTWETVGDSSPSGFAQDTYVKTDAAGNLYYAFGDGNVDYATTVMKYNGTTWQTVGSPGFTDGDNISLAFDKNNTPFITFDGAGTVMKFSGTDWTTVGKEGEIGDSSVNYMSLAFNDNNEPLVSYQDENYTKDQLKASVERFDGAQWVYVGDKDFSPAQSAYNEIIIDKNGVPAVMYSDYNRQNKVTMMRFINNAWTTDDQAGITNGPATSTSIATDISGNTYLSYLDVTQQEKLGVKKYNNGIWDLLGNTVISDSTAYSNSLAVYNNVPYVVYADAAKQSKLTAKKFVNGNWQTLGAAGFTAYAAYATSIAFDAAGTPYIACGTSPSSDYKVSVMKYNGTAWQLVGASGFSAGQPASTSIAIDAAGTPYVAYQDYNWDDENEFGRAVVMKYDGSAWVKVGASVSDAFGTFPTLSIDNSNVPYVAYRDEAADYKVTLKKFSNNAWTTVGNPGFSDGDASSLDFVLDRNNIPYVVYRDEANDNKATVKGFINNSWTTIGTEGFSAGFVNDVSIAINAADNPCITFNSGGAYAYQYDVSALTKAVTYKISGLGKVKPNQKGVVYTLTAPAGTYTWSVPQGAKIMSGQGTKKIKVNWGTKSGYVSAIKKGTKRSDGQGAQLYVTVSSSFDALITSSFINETEKNTAFAVYPNPVSSTANLVFYNPEKETKYTLTLTDASGKTVAKQSGTAGYGSNTIRIAMNQYRSGLYFVTFTTETGTKMIKLYKQ